MEAKDEHFTHTRNNQFIAQIGRFFEVEIVLLRLFFQVHNPGEEGVHLGRLFAQTLGQNDSEEVRVARSKSAFDDCLVGSEAASGGIDVIAREDESIGEQFNHLKMLERHVLVRANDT